MFRKEYIMGIVNRRKLKKRAKRNDSLPHSITPAMIDQARKEMERNKARIDDGDTFRAHQSSKRTSPSKTRNNYYA